MLQYLIEISHQTSVHPITLVGLFAAAICLLTYGWRKRRDLLVLGCTALIYACVPLLGMLR